MKRVDEVQVRLGKENMNLKSKADSWRRKRSSMSSEFNSEYTVQ